MSTDFAEKTYQQFFIYFKSLVLHIYKKYEFFIGLINLICTHVITGVKLNKTF
jgi:hypothetical protein